MPKVTTTHSITFPKLNWAISEGDIRELPEDKEAQNIILASPYISPVEGDQKEGKKK